MQIKIFLFHRVSNIPDKLWDPISPPNFNRMISYITKKYCVVQLENTILGNEHIKTNSKPLAAVVFDDGYKDFIEFALPILKKHNCPSSMYVVTDCVTNQLPPWTYILDYHFIHSEKLTLQLNQDTLPENLRTKEFQDVNQRLEYAKVFKSYLKKIANSQRLELYNQVIQSLNDVSAPTDLILNWDELAQIKKEGIEIGSHSVTHPLLAKIESESDIIFELKNSAETIEKQLGHFPKTISYPIGSYNELVKQKAKDCGYKIGLAVNQTFYNSEKDDRFEIPRTELYNEHFIRTQLRILGIIPKIKTLLNR